jgi:urocanate hydratase
VNFCEFLLQFVHNININDIARHHTSHHHTRVAFRQALKNALRYFPSSLHQELIPEFLSELRLFNHIYMYRLRPTAYEMQAYHIDQYPSENVHANAIMLMIMNNLDPRVAQFPLELVTYGGNGCVFQNWYEQSIELRCNVQMGFYVTTLE